MRTASLRRPGGDLARLPVGFDLHGLDIAEGVRAALACAVVIIANEWIRWPPLVYMALGANLTCFCDVGGPIRGRIPGLLAFSFAGAVLWAGFGVLRPLGIGVVVPLACAVIFCNAFLRVYGPAAAAIGNVLTVVLVFGLDEPLSVHAALVVAAMFVAGGLWCTVLALVIWRLYPARQARVAVAEVWDMLGELAVDLRSLAGIADPGPQRWEAHALAHRRAVRNALERARVEVLELARGRGQAGQRAIQASLRLETADQLFATLIGLADLLEQPPPPATAAAAARLLDLLQALLHQVAHDIRHDRDERGPALEGAVRRLGEAAGEDAALAGLGAAMADRLRVMLALSGPDGGRRFGAAGAGEAAMTLRMRVLGPVRDNLTWCSVMLRHAARTAVISAPALVVTLSYETTFTHWLPYTVVLVMQPFFAATWQRALERVGGTVLGALIGGGLAMLAHSPLALAGLMFPLCVVGFAARQVSYGAYIACLTPQIVVLVELVEPGHSSLEVAAMRALFTLVGGVIAVAGSLLLWPSWEPDRLPAELVRTIGAHVRYARTVLQAARGARAWGAGSGDARLGGAEPGGARAGGVEAGDVEAGGVADAAAGERAARERDVLLAAARREAGLASDNLEAAIGRALQEPRRRDRHRVEAAMAVDAALRRLVARLIAVQHDPQVTGAQAQVWAGWVTDALEAALVGHSALPPRPDAGPEPLLRIALQVELIESAMRRS